MLTALTLMYVPWLQAATEKTSANETTRRVAMAADDVIDLHTATRITSLLVLDKEKAVGVLCGDKTFWAVDVIPGAEQFISIKPAKPGINTDIHVLTDHGNSYTFHATEGGSAPIDLKVFIRPTDESSLSKPPVFYSADTVDKLKRQLADSEAQMDEAKKKAAAAAKDDIDGFRASYPTKIHFSYRFDKGRDPFNIQQIWHDDKGTYIKAFATEQPALYEMKDGKPNLVNFETRENGTLIIIPKILDTAYLQIGKKKTEIYREKTGS